MGIGTGDLLQIVTNQKYLGEDVLNVFYYRYFSAPTVDDGIYTELLNDFNDNIITKIRQIQVDGLVYDTVQVKNVSNNINFAVLPLGSHGVIPASDEAQLPSYISAGFMLLRDSLVTRNGYKRFAGLIDTAVEGNEWVGYTVAINDLLSALAAPLYAGLVQVAAPVIVKRPITPPVGTGYVYSSVAGVLFKGVGTQNSRKP